MLRKVDPISALKVGISGTAIMTIVMYSLPLMGLPPMDIMAALGSVFPFRISPYILGALTHFANGIVIALLFAAFFYSWLPGPNWLKGMLFSLLPWLFAITLLGPSLYLSSQFLGAPSPSSVANPCAVNPCAPKGSRINDSDLPSGGTTPGSGNRSCRTSPNNDDIKCFCHGRFLLNYSRA